MGDVPAQNAELPSRSEDSMLLELIERGRPAALARSFIRGWSLQFIVFATVVSATSRGVSWLLSPTSFGIAAGGTALLASIMVADRADSVRRQLLQTSSEAADEHRSMLDFVSRRGWPLRFGALGTVTATLIGFGFGALIAVLDPTLLRGGSYLYTGLSLSGSFAVFMIPFFLVIRFILQWKLDGPESSRSGGTS